MDIGGHHFSINNLFAPSEPNELLAQENSNGQLVAPFWVYKPKQPRVLFLVWYVPTTLDEKKMLSGTVQQVRAFFSFEEGGAEEQPKQLAFSSLSMAHRCLVEAHNNWSNWRIRVRRANGTIEEVDLKEYQPNKKGSGFVNQQRPFNIDFYTSLDQRLSAVYRSKSRVKQTYRSRSSSPKRESTSQGERGDTSFVAAATTVPMVNKKAGRKPHPLPPSLEDDSDMFAPAVDYQPPLRSVQPPILVLQSDREQSVPEEVVEQAQNDEQPLKLDLPDQQPPNPVGSVPLVFTDLQQEVIPVNEFDISPHELAKITFSNFEEEKEAESSWVVPTTPEVQNHDEEEEESIKPVAAKPKAKRGRKKKQEVTEEQEETEKAPAKRGRAKAKGAGGEEKPKRKYTRRPKQIEKQQEEEEQSEPEPEEETTPKKKRGKAARDASPKKPSRRGKK